MASLHAPLRGIALAALAAALAATAAAGRGSAPDPGGDEPACPWCHDDPALLAAAGLVSHGPFAFALSDTEQLAASLPAAQWIFLESEHLRWASSLGHENVRAKDQERIADELDRLRALFPDVPIKLKKLDPWLRLHLFAMRGEDLYARAQRALGVTDADFPEQRTLEGPYRGDGRYLGEKEKYEVLLHSNRATHHLFTQEHMGLTITDAVRWHFQQRHAILASIPAVDVDLKHDEWLYPHVASNLAHNLLCGYQHYSYDPPVWLDAGFAHMLEIEVHPESHTIDGEEGSKPDFRGPGDWYRELAKLVRKRDLPPMARLLHAKAFRQLTLADNVAAWGMVRFLAEEHPEAFARIVAAVKGKLDERGYPSGAGLDELQRELFKSELGWTVPELDNAFAAWAEQQPKSIERAASGGGE